MGGDNHAMAMYCIKLYMFYYNYVYMYAFCLRIILTYINRPEDEAKSNYYHQEPRSTL